MDATLQLLTDKFLRTCCRRITARDMGKFFSSIGIKANTQMCVEFLETSPWVFALEDGTYVTRAGAFTGELFSIKPTPQEFEQRMFVPGSRCIPFVDSEMFSGALSFYINGKKLPSKIGVFDSDLAIDMFILYGEEYAPQYIGSDPANKDINMVERDFELPNTVNLTGIDISLLIDEYGLKKGDRIICTVTDWDTGDLDITPKYDGANTFDMGEDGAQKLNWYTKLEEALLRSFERMGPCGTIEEQVANVFFENLEDLCVVPCGSIEEYLNRYSKKVGIQTFGVETRLWYKNQNVPAVGSWNSTDIDYLGKTSGKARRQSVFVSVPPEVFDHYIIDSYYRREKDTAKVLGRMFPSDYVFHKDEKNTILERIKMRNSVLSSKYNWFSDQETGKVRYIALELFTKVNALVYKVDCSSTSVQKFPQQELVILTQLYTHLYKILQSLEDDNQDMESLLISLDGMNWNYEDIHDTIEIAIKKQERDGFTLLNP